MPTLNEAMKNAWLENDGLNSTAGKTTGPGGFTLAPVALLFGHFFHSSSAFSAPHPRS